MDEVFKTADFQVTEHLLNSSYGGDIRIDARGQRGGMRLAQTTLTPSVRLDDLRLKMSFDVRASPSGALVIGHLLSGRVVYRVAGSDRAYRSGDVVLLRTPERPYLSHCANVGLELAVIQPTLLSEIAAGEPGRGTEPVRLTGCDPVSPQAAQAWKNTYAYVRDTVLTVPGVAAQPLLAASAARLLTATALAVFPNNALTDPTTEDRHDASPPTLRRAVAFIDEHAEQAITIADIAAAANVTIRAVQLAFRRHLDTTPLAYLRRVRLDHAHRQLQDADPARETVTAVAYRWGFASQSRFAGYYRAAYGVPPRHTLNS